MPITDLTAASDAEFRARVDRFQAGQPVSGVELFLDELDAAREKATPGPWHIAGSGGIDAGDYDTVIGRGDVDCMAHCYGGTSTIEGDNLPADAALIVAAVNALPKLTAALRAVLDLADDWDRNASIFPEYGDLSAAAARSIRAALPAPLAGQHTTDEEADRG